MKKSVPSPNAENMINCREFKHILQRIDSENARDRQEGMLQLFDFHRRENVDSVRTAINESIMNKGIIKSILENIHQEGRTQLQRESIGFLVNFSACRGQQCEYLIQENIIPIFAELLTDTTSGIKIRIYKTIINMMVRNRRDFVQLAQHKIPHLIIASVSGETDNAQLIEYSSLALLSFDNFEPEFPTQQFIICIRWLTKLITKAISLSGKIIKGYIWAAYRHLQNEEVQDNVAKPEVVKLLMKYILIPNMSLCCIVVLQTIARNCKKCALQTYRQGFIQISHQLIIRQASQLRNKVCKILINLSEAVQKTADQILACPNFIDNLLLVLPNDNIKNKIGIISLLSNIADKTTNPDLFARMIRQKQLLAVCARESHGNNEDLIFAIIVALNIFSEILQQYPLPNGIIYSMDEHQQVRQVLLKIINISNKVIYADAKELLSSNFGIYRP